MRFLYIKNEQTCYYCGATLLYGEEATVIRIKHSNGVVLPQFFHTDQCYELWNSETFSNRLTLWRQSAVKRPIRKRKLKTKTIIGRPKKYSNGLQARRVLASLYYHRKAGNNDRVAEIEAQLGGLRVNGNI